MGTSASKKAPSAKRRPSIHSGKLYKHRSRSQSSEVTAKYSNISVATHARARQSLPPQSPPVHGRFTSRDFDKSNLELKQNLPDDLKVYCNSIEIVYRFWYLEIESMDEAKYTETAVLFYQNVFKLLPDVGPLFTKGIEFHAKQFFGMFRWLITNFKEPDPHRLIQKINILGKTHRKMGIKEEWYDAMLQALHDTLTATVHDKYTSRIRFCWEQLYTVVVNIMMGKDFDALSSAKIAKLVQSLNRLQDCLQDDEAMVYLELYMKQQFCVELLMFYKDFRRFKSCPSGLDRQDIGDEMMRKYFGPAAECEINVSYCEIENVRQTLKGNHHIFTEDIFDGCCNECVEMIRNNVWYGFKRSIMKMAVDADIHYHKLQHSKSNTLHDQDSLQSIGHRQLIKSQSLPMRQFSASQAAQTLQIPQFLPHSAAKSNPLTLQLGTASFSSTSSLASLSNLEDANDDAKMEESPESQSPAMAK
eukprot:CAMPEP_0197032240 /NCGR_PEP_ID=MMETSP1384-20130603/10964_1 /TAXON_ID=29189 /ORGANISM="Ammonia sp." /LENGTH=473 /DNA_ID=CAMNT_0042461871 /DNA_START=36 /DNA_END=1457 /DNA_ORIENTATION=-